MSFYQKYRKTSSLLCLTAVLIIQITGVSLAKHRPYVNIELDTDMRIGIPPRIRLRFTINADDGQGLEVPLKIDSINKGIVVEHIALDGTITKQKQKIDKSLFIDSSGYDRIQYLDLCSTIDGRDISPLYFDVWIPFAMLCKTLGLNGHFDFSQPGVYQISYDHPWAGLEEDPNEVAYSSDKLTIIPVNYKEIDRLWQKVFHDHELQLDSYRFRNPPMREMPEYARDLTPKLKEAIQGTQPEFVLFLLGSPDFISTSQNNDINNMIWFYTTSPVGGVSIRFHNFTVI